MVLEEFYQPVYHDFFFKWIVLNTKTYIDDLITCKIQEETDQMKTITFDIHNIHGEIIIWFTNIVEEKILNTDTQQILFYLHYTIADLSQCRLLFQEFYRTLLIHGNEKLYRIALCGQDGLSTSVFVDEMKEVCEMDNLTLYIESLSLDELKNSYSHYDVAYLAPQIAYAQPEVLTATKHQLPIHRIDPTDFATKNYQAILDTMTNNIDKEKCYH